VTANQPCTDNDHSIGRESGLALRSRPRNASGSCIASSGGRGPDRRNEFQLKSPGKKAADSPVSWSVGCQPNSSLDVDPVDATTGTAPLLLRLGVQTSWWYFPTTRRNSTRNGWARVFPTQNIITKKKKPHERQCYFPARRQ